MAIAAAGKESRRRAGRRSKHKPMSEINVTPFVDVVLVLLIIFIVAAPLLTVGVEIKLPETSAEALPSEDEEPLAISVAQDGSVALQSSTIPVDDLIPRLRAVMAERSSDKIFIRGDSEVRYEVIMQIMGALNNAGYRNIGLVTDPGGPEFDGGGG